MGTPSRIRFVAVASTLLVLLFLFLQACGRNDNDAGPTPRAGGVVEGPAADAPAPEATIAPPSPTPEPTPFVFAVDDGITSVRQVLLFAEPATASSVLESYEAGAAFTVMEPSAGFDGYPVTSGGLSWVRLRAADGLAGWARADSLVE